MNKIKSIAVAIFVPILILIILFVVNFIRQEEFKQKAVLAQEIRKTLDCLMIDIYQGKEGSFKYFVADGVWHNHITFDVPKEGPLEYMIIKDHLYRINNTRETLVADHIADLRIRRQMSRPDVLEVQVEAKNGVSLTSNLRIRIK